MPVRDLGGSRLVVRLPDEKKLTKKQKKYLEPRLNKLNSDGEIWVIFGSSGGADVGGDYQELLELGFKGEDDGHPDMYSVPFASGVEIPWAHMVKAKYTDDNFPWMSLLWMMKTSTNWTFEDRPFRIATEEEYVAQMAWLNEKDKPNNVLPFAKVTKKVNINTLIRGSAGKPKTKPEGFLRISVLMIWITCDPDGKSRNSDRPVSGNYCQLISSVGNSISKGPKPDFKFEAQGVAHELTGIDILFSYRDLVDSEQPAGEKNRDRDCFILAGSYDHGRAVGEFTLSQKVFKGMYEDCLANKRMQIFDLRFHNNLQRADGFTVECSDIEASDGNTNQMLRLKSDYDGAGMYIAEVVDRSSMSVTEYIEKMHFDPIFKYSEINYSLLSFNDSFIEFLDKNRARLQDGKVNHSVEFPPRVGVIPMTEADNE